MQQLFKNIHNTFKAICKPNPKLYPDSSVHQFMWNRNITSFYICLLFFVCNIPLIKFCDFSPTMTLMVFGIHGSVFLSFVLLCRSYLWAFNGYYVFISCIYGFKGFDIGPEASYMYVSFIFTILVCTMLLTGDAKLTFFSGFVNLIGFLTKFKEELAIVIRDEDPEIFAEKFVKTTSSVIVLLLISYITLVRTLEKRTLELLRLKGDLENVLEQQKTFIFSFSHELRNPINSLLGNLQLVLQQGGGGLSARMTEMINIAKVCGEILLHNINNVLDTGKHDIGKLEINPVSTPLYELFRKTWSIYSELLRQKKLRGELRIDKDIPAAVKVDSHKLNQIMLNLIGNAIKFTEKGSVVVTVKWLKSIKEVNDMCFDPIPYDDVDEGLFEKEENLSTTSISRYEPGFQDLNETGRQISRTQISGLRQESRGILKMIVKDTGSGMKKEALEKLFKKFSQVSENASQRQIGTGLGLFITKEICVAMNGEIRVYSKFGVGTTLIVCIPTISMPASDIQRVGSESILRELTQKHIKALVADDSPFNVNLICNYFSQFGASVLSVAYNGYDAFMKYQEKSSQLDVITLDIDMPIMNGKMVCDKIRQFEKEKRLKPAVIILISGNYDKEQMNEFISPENGRHRADCFLRKPVSDSEFNRAVYNLLFPERG